jgi:hypothetical protein
MIPIQEGEETSLFSYLGFEKENSKRRIQQTLITKVQEEFHNLFLMLLLIVRMMMLMEFFTSSQFNLKP